MALDPATALFELGKTAIEKIWPDATKRAEQLFELEKLKQSGNLEELNAHVQIMLAQIDVNKESAKHRSLFVSGARPAAIWAGVGGIVYAAILHPIFLWAWALMSVWIDIPKEVIPPTLETSALFALVSSLLGVAGMRSYDATQGTKISALT